MAGPLVAAAVRLDYERLDADSETRLADLNDSKKLSSRRGAALLPIVLEVADEGTGFDLDACTIDATRPDNLEREDGRGLFLMRSLMDRVERYEHDAHNVVRLILNRS
jgi:serine/threonine-protein kinase RsbW